MRTLLTLRPPPAPPSSSSLLLPCLSALSPPPSSSHLFSFRPNKRFHFLTPCSSLKQSKKKSLQNTPNAPPQSQRWFFNTPKSDDGGDVEKTDEDEDGGFDGDSALKGTVLAGVFLVGIVGGFAGVGYVYKDQINAFLNQFSTLIEGADPRWVKVGQLTHGRRKVGWGEPWLTPWTSEQWAFRGHHLFDEMPHDPLLMLLPATDQI